MEYHEIDDPDVFHALVKRFSEARSSGVGTDLRSPQEYSGMRMFVSKDRTSGVALNHEEIVTPFNFGSDSMAAHQLLQLATDEGGRQLAAPETALPVAASQMGFKAVARTPSRELELYPNADEDFNTSNPDIIHMVWDPFKPRPFVFGEGKPVGTREAAVKEQQKVIEEIRKRHGSKTRLKY